MKPNEAVPYEYTEAKGAVSCVPADETAQGANATGYKSAPPELTDEERTERAEVFGRMIIPTIVYAIVYTICLYDNLSGVLTGVFAVASEVYCIYIMRAFGRSLRAGSAFYMIVMALLGFSNGLTGDGVIIFFNTLFFAVLLVVFLLHNYYDDSEWGLTRYLYAICASVFGSIPCLSDFMLEAYCYTRDESNEKRRTLMGVLVGVCIALPLLIVVTALLYSADIVFAAMLRDTLRIDGWTLFGVVVMLAFAFISAYCGTRFMQRGQLITKDGDSRRFEPVVAITALSSVSVVYLVFSVIQIVYLFIGNMTLPENYTYARYAREGFFELLAVCILNVVIVLFTLARFRRHRVINILLIMISACTYIMIASSALRMLMYIDAYHLSRLRVMVLWGLALIAVLLVGIVISVIKQGFPLFRYGVVVAGIAYLILSYSHMDYFIARYNLQADRIDYTEEEYDTDETGNIIIQTGSGEDEWRYVNYYDYNYLMRLSSDAAPAFAESVDADSEWVDNYLVTLARTTDLLQESPRQYNASHAYVRSVFGERISELIGE